MDPDVYNHKSKWVQKGKFPRAAKHNGGQHKGEAQLRTTAKTTDTRHGLGKGVDNIYFQFSTCAQWLYYLSYYRARFQWKVLVANNVYLAVYWIYRQLQYTVHNALWPLHRHDAPFMNYLNVIRWDGCTWSDWSFHKIWHTIHGQTDWSVVRSHIIRAIIQKGIGRISWTKMDELRGRGHILLE